jgi:hypothetical protein
VSAGCPILFSVSWIRRLDIRLGSHSVLGLTATSCRPVRYLGRSRRKRRARRRSPSCGIASMERAWPTQRRITWSAATPSIACFVSTPNPRRNH